MANKRNIQALRTSRMKRVRSKMEGTAEKPRVSVYRSNKSIYLQAFDDVAGVTLAGTKDVAGTGTKTERAEAMAKDFATVLQEKNITQVIFDRGPYRYHGRIKAVAEALRSAGIKV